MASEKNFKNVISGESAQEYSPWEMPLVGSNGSVSANISKKNNIEDIKAQAKEQGFQEGHQQGYATGKQEVDELILHLKNALNSLSQPVALVNEEVEAELLNFVVVLTKKCLAYELSIKPENILPVINEVKSLMPINAATKVLMVNPDDYQFLKAQIDSGSLELKDLELVEEATLSRGECQFKSDLGKIDATVEARVATAIENCLNNVDTQGSD